YARVSGALAHDPSPQPGSVVGPDWRSAGGSVRLGDGGRDATPRTWAYPGRACGRPNDRRACVRAGGRPGSGPSPDHAGEGSWCGADRGWGRVAPQDVARAGDIMIAASSPLWSVMRVTSGRAPRRKGSPQ